MPPSKIPPRPPINFTDHDMLIPPIHRREEYSNDGKSATSSPSAWLSSPVGSAVIAGSVFGLISTIVLIYVVVKVLWPQYKFRRDWRAAAKRRKDDTLFQRQYADAVCQWRAQGKTGAYPKPPKLTTMSDLENGARAGPSIARALRLTDSPSAAARARLQKYGRRPSPPKPHKSDSPAARARARLAAFGNPLGSHPSEQAPGSAPIESEAHDRPLSPLDLVRGPEGGLRFFGEYSPQAQKSPYVESLIRDSQSGFVGDLNDAFAIGYDSDDEGRPVIY